MNAQKGTQFYANATKTDTPYVSDIFQHLAEATAADCTAIANLTLSNLALSEELQARNNDLQALHVTKSTLQKKKNLTISNRNLLH